MKALKTTQKLLFGALSALIMSGSVSATELGDIDFDTFDRNDSAIFARINDQQVFVIGTIDQTAADRFHQYLADNPNTRQLVIGEVPGSADDAANRTILETVIDRGLDTHLFGYGYSGGADLWFSGRKRTLDEGSELGIHSWGATVTEEDLAAVLDSGEIDQATYDAALALPRDENGLIQISGTMFPRDDPQHRPYIDTLEASGIPNAEEFYFFTLSAAPADDIHIITDEELDQWKLVRSRLFTNVDSEIMPDDFKAALSSVQGPGIGGVLQSFYTSDKNQLQRSVRQLSPVTSSLANASFDNMRQQQYSLERHLASRRDIASNDPSGRLWLDRSHSRLDREAESMAAGYKGRTKRWSVGYDLAINDLGLFGVSLSDNNTTLDYQLEKGSSELDETSLNLYHTKTFGHWISQASIAYSDLSGDINRSIPSINKGQNARADVDGNSTAVNVNLAYQMSFGNVNFNPKIGMAYNDVSIESYTETGSLLAVESKNASFQSLTAKLGFDASYSNDAFIPGEFIAHAYWSHELKDTDRVSSSRFVQGGGSFRVKGAQASDNYLYAGLSYNVKVFDAVSLGLSAAHEKADDAKQTILTLNARYHF